MKLFKSNFDLSEEECLYSIKYQNRTFVVVRNSDNKSLVCYPNEILCINYIKNL
jgi:hypothetical protein